MGIFFKWNIELLKRSSLLISSENVLFLLNTKKVKKEKRLSTFINTKDTHWKELIVKKLSKEYEEDRIIYNAERNTIKARNLIVRLVLFQFLKLILF